MRIDLIELLRCPRDHEPTPLVTVAYERDGDHLLSGSLGCPVCHANFTLRDGIAVLGAPAGTGDTPLANTMPDVRRLAALLNLAEPGMRVALCGTYATAAAALDSQMDVQCVAINGVFAPPMRHIDQLSVHAAARFPVADGAFHALALDTAHGNFLADVTRVVRAGGRIVAPVSLEVPAGCRERARDDVEWVAEVTAPPATTSAPVTLRRGSAYG